MTRDDNERADLERAARKTAESRRLAEETARHSQEHVREALSWAAILRRLREENGFHELFQEAFGGGGRHE